MDPIGDGNCGFRCIAHQVLGDQELWPQVRKEMAELLVSEKDNFVKMLGGEKEFNQIIRHLKHNWLNKLDMGQIAADTFQRPVCFYSLAECCTYVPFKVPPNSHAPICISHVNNNHWILLSIKDPLFPIPPICKVPKVLSKKWSQWKKHFQKELLLYQKD